MQTIAYIRISDSDRQQADSQRHAVHAYAEKHGYTISKWIEEHVSATTTKVQDRELAQYVDDGHRIIMTDATRLGRRKVFGLLGVIDQICDNGGELHFAYTDRIITADNMDDAEVIFTMVGQSYAAAEESKARSNRAKAAHARRKTAGLHVGRKKGQVVKSKLDEHLPAISKWLGDGVAKTEIIKRLDAKGCSVGRKTLYTWMDKRGVVNPTKPCDLATQQDG